MRDLLVLAVHLLATVVKLLRPSGARAVAAESLLPEPAFVVQIEAPFIDRSAR
jgi:hypothetical protein